MAESKQNACLKNFRQAFCLVLLYFISSYLFKHLIFNQILFLNYLANAS